MTLATDTRHVAKRLMDAGFEAAQANAIIDALIEQRDELATKADVETLRTELDYRCKALSADIENLRVHLESKIDSTKNELVTESNSRFHEVDARFNKVDARFNKVDARFETLESRIDHMTDRMDKDGLFFRWMFGLMFALQFGILARLFFA